MPSYQFRLLISTHPPKKINRNKNIYMHIDTIYILAGQTPKNNLHMKIAAYYDTL